MPIRNPPASGGGGASWHTVKDLDFRTLPDQTLPDGPVVIDGDTWTSHNNAAADATTAIVSGQGLVIQPQAVNFSPGSPASPYLSIPPPTWYPDFGMLTPWRLWMEADTSGLNQNYKSVMAALFYNRVADTPALLGGGFQYADNKTAFSYPFWNTTSGSHNVTIGNTDNQVMVECAGLARQSSTYLYGPLGAPWTAEKNLRSVAPGFTTTSVYSGILSSWNAILTAFRPLAGAFSATIYRVRFDVYY